MSTSKDFRRAKTRSISVSSGKGGVGKSTLVANLAIAASRLGQKVLLLDGDLGMANLDLMFGLRSRGSIHDVLADRMSMAEILLPIRDRIFLLPGGSGVYGMSRLDHFQRQIILEQVAHLDEEFDLLIVDTAPGIDDNVLFLSAATEETIVVVTPDPASFTDAYAFIKVLHERHRQNRFSIVTNMVRDESEGLQIYRKLSEVVDRFLQVQLDWMGAIVTDPAVRQATKSQQLIIESCPDTVSSGQIANLAKKLCGYRGLREARGGIQFFWEQLSGVA